MNERQFEDILTKYPELIEEGLSLSGRQVWIEGKCIDLLFNDRHGHRLIVELKKGPILRKHIAQLLDYEGHFLIPDDPTVRVMLIGNRVPNNLQRALDHHGFEWKELKIGILEKFLIEKDDQDLLKIFEGENLKTSNEPILDKLDKTWDVANHFKKRPRSRKMGHRTGNSLFGTKTRTMANHFCHAVIASGSIGITMAEAKKAHWNPKKYSFNETVSRLIEENLVTIQNDRHVVTEKGLKEAGNFLFGTKTGTMENHFCHAVIASGSIGITMAEAKKAHWNPKGDLFEETLSHLIEKGLATVQNGRYFVTEKGLKEA